MSVSFDRSAGAHYQTTAADGEIVDSGSDWSVLVARFVSASQSNVFDTMSIIKLVPALQLQYGERHFNSATGRYDQSEGNVQVFIRAMTDQIADAINDFGGGRKLYENLFGYTLPNILNHRIERSALSEGRERLHLDDVEDLKEAMNKINRTALAYKKFTA